MPEPTATSQQVADAGDVHLLYSYDEDGDEFCEPCRCAKTYDHDEEGYRYEGD